jgi:hypothetical protein
MINSHRFEPGPRVIRVPGADPGGGVGGAGEGHRRSHRLCFLRLAPLRIGGHPSDPEDDQEIKTIFIFYKYTISVINFSQSAHEIGDVRNALLGFWNSTNVEFNEFC